MRAFIGLGSNLGDREENMRNAVRALDATPNIEVVQVSSIYETEPVGGPAQPDYLNAVVEINTILGPRAIFEPYMTIPELGRVHNLEERLLVTHTVKPVAARLQ